MRRLLLVVSGLCVLLMIVLIAVRGIGSSQPVAESVRWWHLTDCRLPCWEGFVIGSTPELEVEGRLRGLFPPPKAAVQRDSWEGTTTLTMNVLSTADARILKVGSVSVWFPNRTTSGIFLRGDSLPTLGDVFNLLGPPTCVIPDSTNPNSGPTRLGANFLILEYVDQANHLTIELNVGPPQWTTPIDYFDVSKINAAGLCANGTPWRGLSSAEVYRQRLMQTP